MGEATKIAVAEVVAEQHDDVGARRRRGCKRERWHGEQEREKQVTDGAR
jgi:hypothetical protein